MKSMPYIIALVLVGSAFGSDIDVVERPSEMAAKKYPRPEMPDVVANARKAIAERPSYVPTPIVQEAPRPMTTTISPCGSGYQIITDYSNGRSDVSQAGPCGSGWTIIHDR